MHVYPCLHVWWDGGINRFQAFWIGGSSICASHLWDQQNEGVNFAHFLNFWFPKLRSPVCKRDLGLKNAKLRSSFWVHNNYIIVMGVGNLPGNIKMEITDVKLAFGPFHHGYIKNHI